MTYDDIIMAFICHKSKSLLDCQKCPLYAKKMSFEQCHIELFDSLYDLINCQKAEIEELKAINESLKTDRPFLVAISRSEARKEFAERLKAVITINNTNDGYLDYAVDYNCLIEDIDNLLKEMESESNG